MKDLESMFDEAIEVINECINGVDIYPIKRPLTINRRAKSRWGRCKKNTYKGECEIEISERILSDSVPYDATMSTIIHEILHACVGCQGHGGLWKKYAEIINSKRPQFNITRTSGAEAFGLETEQTEIKRKYAIKCEGCGLIHYSSKMSNTIKHPERYRCAKCGGKMHRIDIRDIEVKAPAPSVSGQLCLLDM